MQGIAVGHILKGRSDEWWKVKLHGIAVLGFFIGGVLGVFAAQVCTHGGCVCVGWLYVLERDVDGWVGR